MKNFKSGTICVNDIWLISFFVIQLTYTVLSTIMPVSEGNGKYVLDVIMRTSTAVLAGYFLSKNFSKPKHRPASPESRARHTIQSNVVGIIGLFALCLTLIVRYVDRMQLPDITVAQLRDFYLASIAFLMGTSE